MFLHTLDQRSLDSHNGDFRLPSPEEFSLPFPTTEEATERKRKDLQLVIAPVPAFGAVVAVGSVGSGRVRDRSDIDAVVFMDPVDRFILPTESIWCPWDNSFHSIFVKDRRIQRDGIHLDLMYRDLQKWSQDSFEWPEPDKAGLVKGWFAFDRDGTVEPLVKRRTQYDEKTRKQRLDDFLLAVDGELVGDRPSETRNRFGPIVAFRRLECALDAVVGGLFAYNRSWRFYRDRETVSLLQLFVAAARLRKKASWCSGFAIHGQTRICCSRDGDAGAGGGTHQEAANRRGVRSRTNLRGVHPYP